MPDSAQRGRIVSLIIAERFGPVIETITKFLFKFSPSSLLNIKRGVDLPLSKVGDLLHLVI